MVREVHSLALLSFLVGYGRIVQFDQVGQGPDDELSVVLTLSYGIVPQPQYLQLVTINKTPYFKQITYHVFPEVQFLQILAILKVTETREFV